jgi:hypothetical protein
VILLRFQKRVTGAATLAALLVLVACDRGQVRTYTAPKDSPPVADRRPGAGRAIGQVPEVATPSVSWKLPAGWQELPASQMRVGHFAINGPEGQQAQLTIIPLGGMGGGDLENVNRWRGQVSLGRIDEAELNRIAEKVAIGGAEGRLFDFAGTTPDEDKPARMIAAILHREGTAWFFKLLGDDKLVAEQKPAMIEFLKSITFGAPSAGTAMLADSSLPDGHPPVPGNPSAAAGLPEGHPPVGASSTPAAPAPATPAIGKSEWKLPAGWKELTPGTFQRARFLAAESGNDKAEATISILAGTGGGDLANVNRWRGQVGLAPITEAELNATATAVEADGRPARLVDLTGPNGQQRIVAVIAARDGETVFYRLSGRPELVAAQKDAFLAFVKSPR